MTGIANSQFELLESRAVEAQHPGEMEEILELEEAFKIAERSVEANAQGLLQEIGHESRRKLDELATPIDLEVAAEFEAEEAKRNQPPPRTAKDFADAATLPWTERSKLVDELLSAKVESWEK